MGLSPDKFWGLTWYEWGLYVLKLHKDRQKELSDRELSIEQHRQAMALHYNIHRGNNPAKIPQDFWRLSYDKDVVEERPMTFKEAKALMGSKIKRANGGE
jgi:hypothetical protein